MAVQEGGLKTPFSDVQAGQTLQASVIGINATGCGKGNRIRYVSELTTRPSALDAARRGELPAPAATIPDLAPGQRIVGAVHSVAKDHLFVALSGSLRGYVHALNCAPAVAAGATLRKLHRVGQLVRCTVIALDSDSQRIDLSLLPHSFARVAPRADAAPEEGQLVMAEVKSVAGACVVCTLANGVHAAAALTCLHDTFVPNALEGVRPGAVVVGKVLAGGQDGKGRIALSLQQRDGGKHAGVPFALPAGGSLQRLARLLHIHSIVLWLLWFARSHPGDSFACRAPPPHQKPHELSAPLAGCADIQAHLAAPLRCQPRRLCSISIVLQCYTTKVTCRARTAK